MIADYEQGRARLVEKLLSGEPWSDSDILDLYRFQYWHNTIYHRFCSLLHRTPEKVHDLDSVPFLPVSAFKDHDVVTGDWLPGRIFKSSGTTGQERSRHFIRDPDIYHYCCRVSFQMHYGDPADHTWLALLPSYIEAGDSSLVDMVHFFMSLSDRSHEFFMHDVKGLVRRIKDPGNRSEKQVLIGVSYALLDLAGIIAEKLPERVIVMETGGMKGRRAELTRVELHAQLKKGFGINRVHSEYGMTEMMHQLYAQKEGIFHIPTGVRVRIREINDPLTVSSGPGTGLLNIVDTGNIDSCAFLATDDLVTIRKDGTLEVLGRSDNSEMRGCNLLYTAAGPLTI